MKKTLDDLASRWRKHLFIVVQHKMEAAFPHQVKTTVGICADFFMKVRFNIKSVLSGLQKAISITPSKGDQAYLKCLWITAEKDHITFQSTDASLEFMGSYGAEVSEEGKVGVQGQIFYNLIHNCIDDVELNFAENDSTLHITHKLGKCKLPVVSNTWYQPVTPFPAEPMVTCSGSLLTDALSKVAYCISEDDSFNALTCLCIRRNPNQKVDFCGLNGQQLSLFSFVHDQLYEILPTEGIVIQKIYLSQINKWLEKGEVDIIFTDKRIFFKNANEILTVPLATNCVYPDYNSVLAKFDVEDATYIHLS